MYFFEMLLDANGGAIFLVGDIKSYNVVIGDDVVILSTKSLIGHHKNLDP